MGGVWEALLIVYSWKNAIDLHDEVHAQLAWPRSDALQSKIRVAIHDCFSRLAFVILDVA